VPVEIALHQETLQGQSVFVSGPMPLLGGGDVRHAVKLSPHRYPVWSLVIDLPPGTSFQPKFYLRDDAPARLADAQNATPIPTSHTLATPAAETSEAPRAGSAPGAPASIPRRESFTWTPSAPLFKPRTITVLLPRGYDDSTTRRYPVLYAEDGQNVFSPGGPFGSWDLDLIATDLMRSGEIPGIIIVAIDNGGIDRIAEYIPEWIVYEDVSTRGGEYLRLLIGEVMPEIDRRYRTKQGPANTAHLGSSLGGVIGFEAANEHADVFGAVVAMSPSFWLNRPGFVERAGRPPSTRARLYIDSGTEGTRNDACADTMAVRDALIGSGHVFGAPFLHTVGLADGHNEAAWRGRLPGALRWLYAPTTTTE
jgi:predicted alpha/beta superfamily hydrolase